MNLQRAVKEDILYISFFLYIPSRVFFLKNLECYISQKQH